MYYIPDDVGVLVLGQAGEHEAGQQLITVKAATVSSNLHRCLQPLCCAVQAFSHQNLLQPITTQSDRNAKQILQQCTDFFISFMTFITGSSSDDSIAGLGTQNFYF